jgi:SAM-dependent methyltransferase
VGGAAGHLGIELRDYDARIRTFIPEYETLLASAADTLAATVRRRRPLVVDLGVGTGALSAACLARVPGARIFGIDEDAGILDVARRRLGHALRGAVHDSFERAALPRGDAVVASLALHHIPTRARRLRLFRRVRAALGRGGVLISADCHPPADPRLAAAGRAAWLAHLARTYTPAESRRYLRAWAREDHYATLPDEIATLQRAGFVVDVVYRSGTFAVIVAAVA